MEPNFLGGGGGGGGGVSLKIPSKRDHSVSCSQPSSVHFPLPISMYLNLPMDTSLL